jgi:hypothetical protein
LKYQITVTSFFHPDSFYIPTDAMKKRVVSVFHAH